MEVQEATFREGILDAKASIDWALSQLPSFQERLEIRYYENIAVGIKKLEPPAPTDIVVATQKEPLPRAFNAEFGAYLNAIRCSLDILMTSVAIRYGV